ncbi:MAG: DUF6662 family protein [Planctomycetota bacterium]|jgi:hypothetical protein
MTASNTHVAGLARLLASAAACLAAAAVQPADANERRFTYSYESTTHPVGAVEYEQWVTWKTNKDGDASFHRFDFRHELEFGLNDTTQLGLYLSDWRYERGDSVDNGATWRNVGVEVIHALTDPVTDALGTALYGEIKFGDELFELEGKLIVQKNVGKWVLAWNGTMAAEWEGSDYDEDKGEFKNTLGASYQVTPSFLVGAELLHEVEYEDWSDWGPHALYLGPNAAFRTEAWWITLTPLFETTNTDEPDFQLRAIVGFDF